VKVLKTELLGKEEDSLLILLFFLSFRITFIFYPVLSLNAIICFPLSYTSLLKFLHHPIQACLYFHNFLSTRSLSYCSLVPFVYLLITEDEFVEFIFVEDMSL